MTTLIATCSQERDGLVIYDVTTDDGRIWRCRPDEEDMTAAALAPLLSAFPPGSRLLFAPDWDTSREDMMFARIAVPAGRAAHLADTIEVHAQ